MFHSFHSHLVSHCTYACDKNHVANDKEKSIKINSYSAVLSKFVEINQTFWNDFGECEATVSAESSIQVEIRSEPDIQRAPQLNADQPDAIMAIGNANGHDCGNVHNHLGMDLLVSEHIFKIDIHHVLDS